MLLCYWDITICWENTEVELEKEQINLIKKIIKSDKKYLSNEDLFEDFLNETYKRSFVIIKTVKKEASLEAYLRKIVTTSIVTVLKDSGRVQRVGQSYVPTKEKSIEEIISRPINKYSNVHIDYDIVDLNDGPEEIVIKKEISQKLIDTILIANNTDPQKQYLQLYKLRYVKGMKQKQIALELNLSQSEVSKRLMELMEKVKDAFKMI